MLSIASFGGGFIVFGIRENADNTYEGRFNVRESLQYMYEANEAIRKSM